MALGRHRTHLSDPDHCNDKGDLRPRRGLGTCGPLARRLGLPSSAFARAAGNWRLLYLDQFQRLATRSFNHYGARVTKLVRLFEERDALSPQLGDPSVKVADAERD